MGIGIHVLRVARSSLFLRSSACFVFSLSFFLRAVHVQSLLCSMRRERESENRDRKEFSRAEKLQARFTAAGRDHSGAIADCVFVVPSVSTRRCRNGRRQFHPALSRLQRAGLSGPPFCAAREEQLHGVVLGLAHAVQQQHRGNCFTQSVKAWRTVADASLLYNPRDVPTRERKGKRAWQGENVCP